MSEEPCKACVRRWEIGDVQGSIDPRVTPWHDPHHALIHAERWRANRLEAALREADTALLRALSDLMGYEDGRRTATQDLVKHAAEGANAALEGSGP